MVVEGPPLSSMRLFLGRVGPSLMGHRRGMQTPRPLHKRECPIISLPLLTGKKPTDLWAVLRSSQKGRSRAKARGRVWSLWEVSASLPGRPDGYSCHYTLVCQEPYRVLWYWFDLLRSVCSTRLLRRRRLWLLRLSAPLTTSLLVITLWRSLSCAGSCWRKEESDVEKALTGPRGYLSRSHMAMRFPGLVILHMDLECLGW